MARYQRGDVVVLPFPFSDLSAAKRRPALVLVPLDGDDVILCMITSQHMRDPHAFAISVHHFAHGGLPHSSFVRPARLFTADSRTILRVAGRLTTSAQDAIAQILVSLITAIE